jgi:hypothetical protein
MQPIDSNFNILNEGITIYEGTTSIQQLEPLEFNLPMEPEVIRSYFSLFMERANLCPEECRNGTNYEDCPEECCELWGGVWIESFSSCVRSRTAAHFSVILDNDLLQDADVFPASGDFIFKYEEGQWEAYIGEVLVPYYGGETGSSPITINPFQADNPIISAPISGSGGFDPGGPYSSILLTGQETPQRITEVTYEMTYTYYLNDGISDQILEVLVSYYEVEY